jgi:hypothetical protein
MTQQTRHAEAADDASRQSAVSRANMKQITHKKDLSTPQGAPRRRLKCGMGWGAIAAPARAGEVRALDAAKRQAPSGSIPAER